MSVNLRFLWLTMLLMSPGYPQWFFGNSIFTGSGFSNNVNGGVKLYVQHESFPVLAVTASYTYFHWIQPGVTYTQGGTDFLIGSQQPLSQNALTIGVAANIWAKGSWYVDLAANYMRLQELTFSEPIQDASFPISGYSAEFGVGYNFGYWSLRPYYAFFHFSDDYTVLNQTMLELKSQHTFGLELIYWY